MQYTVRELINPETSIYTDLPDSFLDYKIISGDFFEEKPREDGKTELWFKNVIRMTDVAEMAKILDAPKDFFAGKIFDKPFLMAGLEEYAEAVKKGEITGIMGGPCLFGENEVLVHIGLNDGTTHDFDYSTGKNYLNTYEYYNTTNDLAEFIAGYSTKIETITFEDKKEYMTIQELESIIYPFHIASFTGSKVVIPIPDLSYIKFLKCTVAHLHDEARENDIVERFSEIAYRIADIYIDAVKIVAQKYPNVEYTVFHGRDKELCEKFYKLREPFIERNKVLHAITGAPEKYESIKDYISMPALPHYLYGAVNVLQFDTLDETDSFRKCRKAHKGAFEMSGIMYFEGMSNDGVSTIFHAERKDKFYVTDIRKEL